MENMDTTGLLAKTRRPEAKEKHAHARRTKLRVKVKPKERKAI